MAGESPDSSTTGPAGPDSLIGVQSFPIGTVNQAMADAPVIHIDGAVSFAAHGQVTKFNLYQDRLIGGEIPPGAAPIERIICARLVMSPMVLKQLADWLTKQANDLIASGILVEEKTAEVKSS